MKRAVYLVLTTIILASCGEKTSTEKSAEKLGKLKKERAELDKKIADLEKQVNKNNPGKATAVSITTVAHQPFTAYIQVQAQVTGDENVLATPQSPGIVKNILVKVGQRVSKGQTLATLDAAAVQQQIQAMDAQLGLAKTLYEKQQKLWAQNIGTQVQLLQSKANYENLLSQKHALVAQREMYLITAPISGVVDGVELKEGDMATPGGNGSHGIRVVSKDKLKATANLGENYLGKVQSGDPVLLVFPDLNDSLKTHLSYVSQAVDPVSRAFGVEVRLGSNNRLHPSMSCKMKIANYENKDAIIIPISVVQRTGSGDIVYVAEGNKAKAVVVQVGRISNGNAEILSGLKAGDKVITAGYEDLDNGELITVQ